MISKLNTESSMEKYIEITNKLENYLDYFLIEKKQIDFEIKEGKSTKLAYSKLIEKSRYIENRYRYIIERIAIKNVYEAFGIDYLEAKIPIETAAEFINVPINTIEINFKYDCIYCKLADNSQRVFGITVKDVIDLIILITKEKSNEKK